MLPGLTRVQSAEDLEAAECQLRVASDQRLQAVQRRPRAGLQTGPGHIQVPGHKGRPRFS